MTAADFCCRGAYARGWLLGFTNLKKMTSTLISSLRIESELVRYAMQLITSLVVYLDNLYTMSNE